MISLSLDTTETTQIANDESKKDSTSMVVMKVDAVAKEKLEGVIKVDYEDKNSFWGYFVNNKRHGLGTWSLADGTVIIGTFKDDQAHGECKIG